MQIILVGFQNFIVTSFFPTYFNTKGKPIYKVISISMYTSLSDKCGVARQYDQILKLLSLNCQVVFKTYHDHWASIPIQIQGQTTF